METRRMCPHCRAFITNMDRVCPYCHEAVGPRAIDLRNPRDFLGGLIPHAKATTTIFLMINVLLYLATVVYGMNAGNSSAFMNLDLLTLYRFGAKFRQNILEGQWWRIVTAGFLHGGLMHIAMNMWVLMDLGAQVEEVYGTSRYVVIYLCSSVGGFLLSTYWSDAPSVGASAALFGLIGAMIALGVRSRTSMGAAIRGMYIRWAIYGLLFGLLKFFHIDNAAHIGGLTTGFALAYLAGTPRIQSAPREQAWRFAAWACVAVTAYCFLKMYLSFSLPPG
jgi:membrane associated rhomboid family serine protease